jgi:hypothetical protein
MRCPQRVGSRASARLTCAFGDCHRLRRSRSTCVVSVFPCCVANCVQDDLRNISPDSALLPRRRCGCYGAVIRQSGFHALLVRRLQHTRTNHRFHREGHGLGSCRHSVAVCRCPARRGRDHRLLRLLLSSGAWHRRHRDRLPVESTLLEPRPHHRGCARRP